jgi:uncharacterized membrane protein (Fun14 family)
VNLDENLAVTIGGGFFGGILIGYALKKIIKVVAIIAGFSLAALAYLQYQQIANINWDKLQAISGIRLQRSQMRHNSFLDLMAMTLAISSQNWF